MARVWWTTGEKGTWSVHVSGGGQLLFNHVDAWSVTAFIATVALIAHAQMNWAGAWLLFALVVGYWQAFVLNDYFDAPYDRADEQKAQLNFFVHHPLRVHDLVIILLPLDLAVAWGFLQYGWRGVVVMLLCLAIMWAYSAPPFRIKSRPGLDLLTHGCFVETFPYWTCLYLTRSSWRAFDFAAVILLFLASLTAQLEQQLRDYVIDRRFEQTFTTLIGPQRAYRLLQACTALLIVAGVVALVVGAIPYRFAPLGVITLPVLLHRFLRPPTVGRSPRLTWLSLGVGASYLLGLAFFSL